MPRSHFTEVSEHEPGLKDEGAVPQSREPRRCKLTKSALELRAHGGLCAERDRQAKERRAKYSGTSKAIRAHSFHVAAYPE
jgi:hypothetical protein